MKKINQVRYGTNSIRTLILSIGAEMYRSIKAGDITFLNLFSGLFLPYPVDHPINMNKAPSSAVEVLADQHSLSLFCTIAEKTRVNSIDLKKKSKLSNKRYYARTEKLIQSGLVKRREGVFMLTAFGHIFYYACLQIDCAIEQYSTKATDAVQELELFGIR